MTKWRKGLNSIRRDRAFMDYTDIIHYIGKIGGLSIIGASLFHITPKIILNLRGPKEKSEENRDIKDDKERFNNFKSFELLSEENKYQRGLGFHMGKITLEHKFDKGDKVIVSKNYYDTGDNNFKGRIGSIQNITISYFSCKDKEGKEKSRIEILYDVDIERSVWERFPEHVLSYYKEQQISEFS